MYLKSLLRVRVLNNFIINKNKTIIFKVEEKNDPKFDAAPILKMRF